MKQPEIPVDVYVVKVTLLGTSPPVWRRILVPRDITLQRITCPNIKLAETWAWKNNLSLGGNLGW